MAGSEWTPHAALDALIDALDEGVLIHDPALVCRAAGRRAGEILGVPAAELAGAKRSAIVDRARSAARNPSVLAPIEDAALGDRSSVVDGLELDGAKPRLVVWTSLPLANGGRVDVLRDVTGERVVREAHEAIAKKLEQVSTVDELTGLVNRKRFEHEADREHRRAQRAWAPYAIARIDVDGMGAINQKQGQDVGNDVLRRIAEELRSSRREYDLVGRYASDEFILLLPGADPIAAKIVVKRALKGVHAKLKEPLEVTVSAGTAIWSPPSGESAADVIARAGQALASARARGPGSVEIDAGLGQWKDDMSES